MAPLLDTTKIFKCIMFKDPSGIMSDLSENMKYGINQIGKKTFLLVSKTIDGIFDKGYLTDNTQCNLQKINADSQKAADLSTVYDNCAGKIYKVNNIFSEEGNSYTILDQAAEVFQNGTTNIFGQNYQVDDNRFSLDGNVDYLGLETCDTDAGINALQQFKDYLQSLIPTTTTTTESPIDKGLFIKDYLNITSNDLWDAGKKFFNFLGENIPDTTTTAMPTTTEQSNDDSNDGSSIGTYIAVATTVLAVGTLLGYGTKWAIDRYKGKNNVIDNDEENQLLEINDSIYNMRKFIPILVKQLKQLSKIEEKYEDIENEDSTISELNYDKLVNLLNEFNKTLRSEQNVVQTLTELENLMNQNHELKSIICQKNLHTLQDMLQHNDSKTSISHHSGSDSGTFMPNSSGTIEDTSAMGETHDNNGGDFL